MSSTSTPGSAAAIRFRMWPGRTSRPRSWRGRPGPSRSRAVSTACPAWRPREVTASWSPARRRRKRAMKTELSVNAAIIGAGPYGLAAAVHLRAAGVETCVFGEAMEFWETQMPVGMYLRSSWAASHIGHPGRALTLDEFAASERRCISNPIPVDRFIDYGRWFQRRVASDVDRRRVVRIEREAKAFRLRLDDGQAVRARRVVVAAGISRFGWRPRQFDGLSRELA